MSEGAGGPVRGIVVAHGDMARGLTDAVLRISGQGEDALAGLSNEGRSPEELRRDLERMVGAGPAIVFTDLQAGSCAFTALTVCARSRTVVICGTNLPMLLDFVFHRNLPLEELAERLVGKGREGIRRLPAALPLPARKEAPARTGGGEG